MAEEQKNLLAAQHRIDYFDMLDWISEKFSETPEGYLRGRPVLTNVGVFHYGDDMGNMVRELRLPEEVFHPDSIASMRMLPLTNDHPPNMVTKENIKEYQVGFLGGNPMTDAYHITNDVIVTDAKTIEEIKKGKKGLSMGYTCDMEDAEPGAMWCGVPYDKIQRNIRYNHAAVVMRGRAGDAARIRTDSAGSTKILFHEEERMTLKKITLDGVEYEADAEVVKTLTQYKTRADKAEELQKTVDTLTKDKSVIEAERDTLKTKVDSLTEENKTLKDSAVDSKKLDALVKAQIRAREVAGKLQVEVKDEMSELDIIKAVILKDSPKISLDGKSEDYLRARFDFLIEGLEEQGDASIREAKPKMDAETQDSAEAHRDKMKEKILKQSRGESVD